MSTELPEGTMRAAFRVAIRAEGPVIVARLALLDTMEDAIPLGSIVRRVCNENPEIFERFKVLMGDVVRFTLEAQGVQVAGLVEEIVERDPPQ